MGRSSGSEAKKRKCTHLLAKLETLQLTPTSPVLVFLHVYQRRERMILSESRSQNMLLVPKPRDQKAGP